MPQFLSPEWVDALDRAARASSLLAACADDHRLVLEQRVTLPDGSEHAHHLVLAPDGASVRLGRAQDADVVLTVDLETARDLARGALNAQQALARGRLRLGGDVAALTRRADALLALDDVFAATRATTTFTAANGAAVTSAE
jgi:putative sterol carrier protein